MALDNTPMTASYTLPRAKTTALPGQTPSINPGTSNLRQVPFARSGKPNNAVSIFKQAAQLDNKPNAPEKATEGSNETMLRANDYSKAKTKR